MAPPLEQTDMYVAPPMQLWKGLMNWLTFLFQIIVQILRGTPSLTQVLSYVGLHHSYLPSPSFKPLPVVEIPLQEHGSSNDAVDDFHLSRLTVVLDLDETLVCAYEFISLPDSIRTQAVEAGVNCFELECVSSDKECDGRSKTNYVTVFERPGLHEFLKGVSEFANMIVFTAGIEGLSFDFFPSIWFVQLQPSVYADYAKPLLDKIDTEKLIGQRLYRPSTVRTEYREHVKDLTILSKDLGRIVLVDNNPFSFLLQPLNGIPCVPFSASQPRDNQLLEVLLPLLKHLSQQRDVRPELYEKFHMPEWFQMHGIPASPT